MGSERRLDDDVMMRESTYYQRTLLSFYFRSTNMPIVMKTQPHHLSGLKDDEEQHTFVLLTRS